MWLLWMSDLVDELPMDKLCLERMWAIQEQYVWANLHKMVWLSGPAAAAWLGEDREVLGEKAV